MSPAELKLLSTAVYRDHAKPYIENGYSVIPDKYMSKMPAIKGWADYCYKIPTSEEIESWSRFDKSGIALCLGEVSGVVALDIDEVREDILEVIMPMLPTSPVVKVGSKGETRFFRYNGEYSQVLKFNGGVVFEILSTNKKTTLPPSIHPNGSPYSWIGEQELLGVDKNTLPILPPTLFSHAESKLRLTFPEVRNEGAKGLISGRNNELSSYCAKLIQEREPVDSAIKKLIDFDAENCEPPLFTDPDEMRHTEPFTNALTFYSNHLNSVNNKRFRENKEYELPITASAVTKEEGEETMGKKSQKGESPKVLSPELPSAVGVLDSLQSNILKNSWIKQPAFAFSASLVLLGTLMSRKFIFQGMSTNLYALNIAPSGSGKDAPQQKLKEYLIDINSERLLGAGDYVSDASLMDSLSHTPVRLDIMDEAGGILKSINTGRSDYNGKMADILAELYTSSNSKYLGRATAEGIKGSCFRPNVSILASTTPTGFSEGITIKAIEKGLMGRFLVFMGSGQNKAERLKNLPRLDTATLNKLRWLATFKPGENGDNIIGGIKQEVVELEATDKANERLDHYFYKFDDLRRETEGTNPLLPIIARLYQQMVKVVMIHAGSRSNMTVPIIDVEDVEFGYLTISHYFDTMSSIIDKYIFSNNTERTMLKVLNLIKDSEDGLTRTELYKHTRDMTKRERDMIVQDLVDTEQVVTEFRNINGKNYTVLKCPC